jgi:UDP-N-acetyl-D-mannosaminuronic acid dehydrogenase
MGLGYVGLTLATVMVEVGFTVHGIEIRDEVVEKLKRGEAHFSEPGISERLHRAIADGRLLVSKAIPPDAQSTVHIITVGTPIGADGVSRMDMVENVAREVAKHLKDGDLVVLRSTVKIGTTRTLVEPILAATGKRFHLAFCPERTVEGQALEELRWLPQIVGGGTYEATVRAGQLFQFLTPTVVRVGSIETAEMVKLVDNTQRDVHFAFSNEIARLCDAMGISATEVIQAGKLGYPRTNLPLPGPVGGPCLEKDPHILAESARGFGVVAEMAMLGRRINERQLIEVAGFAADMASARGVPERPKIALLGIAFKGRPATDDLRGTTAKPVFEELKRRFPGARFVGYDAVVEPADIAGFGLEPQGSLEEALSGTHLAVILNNHPVFPRMPLEDLATRMAKPALVYDLWNNFDRGKLRMPEGTTYVSLGNHGFGAGA